MDVYSTLPRSSKRKSVMNMKTDVRSAASKRSRAALRCKRPSFILIGSGGAGAAVFVILIWLGVGPSSASTANTTISRNGVLQARTLATGIPGAGAVAEVGDFLRGSPLHDKPAFAVFVQPGQVLNSKRVLVASTSNFGAPLARAGEPEGTILSIDPAAGPLSIPAGFAAAGGQASALGGTVQVYAAQNAAFLNSITEPQAVTAALPSASLPLGISINNG